MEVSSQLKLFTLKSNMGCNISHLAHKKYEAVLVKPTKEVPDRSTSIKLKDKDDESTFTVNTLPTLQTLQRGNSILYDPSLKLDSLLPELKEMGNILQDEKVLHLFYRYLREMNWMDEILQAENPTERSKKNLLHRINTNKRFSVLFHSYCLLSVQESRSAAQQEDMEAQAMYLLHRLKNQEAQEDSELDGKVESILASFSKEEVVSALAAMSLRSFLLSPEYNKMVSCNWMMDVSTIKFKRTDLSSRSYNNLRKFQNGAHLPSGMRKANSSANIPMILTSFEDDPVKQQKQLILEMLGRINFQLFQDVLKSKDWLLPFAQAIHRLPIALSVICHDHSVGNWNIEYVNAQYEAVTDVTAADVVGNDMKHLYWENGDPDHKNNVRFALKHKEACKVSLYNRRKNGEVFIDFMALQPVFEHDIAPSQSHQNSMSNLQPPSPSVVANAAVAAVGAAVSSTSAFFSTSSQSLVVPYQDSLTSTCELEEFPSPAVSQKAVPSLSSSTKTKFSTPAYQRVHRLYAVRRCHRYLSVHTDVENPRTKISDLKKVENLLLILRFIV